MALPLIIVQVALSDSFESTNFQIHFSGRKYNRIKMFRSKINLIEAQYRKVFLYKDTLGDFIISQCFLYCLFSLPKSVPLPENHSFFHHSAELPCNNHPAVLMIEFFVSRS